MNLKVLGILLIMVAGITIPQSLFGENIENVDLNRAGSQYFAYPVTDGDAPVLSPSPEGYYPFHMEHYGRHGSRWRLKESNYENAYLHLKKADDYGKLTPKGKEVKNLLKRVWEDSKKHTGELTPLGHRQHREIARRMMVNYPELFTDSTFLDAKSTVIIRCILSMANEVAEFQKHFPGMSVNMDASYSTQDLLAYNSLDTVAKNLSKAIRDSVTSYAATLPTPENFYFKLFTDRTFVTDSLSESDVFEDIFDVAINMQSHDGYPSLEDLFTPEEIYNEWLVRNADWYITAGNTPLTQNRVPFNQRFLLRNIIESADTALLSKNKSVNLRFGHESILLPLSVLMELDNAAYETTDLTTLADHWRNFEIFPMASNIQIVFYRPYNETELNPENVLVKVTLNEKEVELPIEPVYFPYYKWSELRSYYLSKLSSIPD